MKRSSVYVAVLFLMILIVPAVFGIGLSWANGFSVTVTQETVDIVALAKNISVCLAGLMLLACPQALVDVALHLFRLHPDSLSNATRWLRVVGMLLMVAGIFSGQLELRELMAAVQH